MDKHFIEMAGLRLRTDCPEEFLKEPGILEGYLTSSGDWDHHYHLMLEEKLPEPEGALLFDSDEFTIHRQEEFWTRQIGDYIQVRRHGRESSVIYRRGSLPHGIGAKPLLMAMELEQLLADHDGFLLHASYIRHDGGAILFTAPSETGKSTQAQLWCDFKDAELINGDRVAVRMLDGRAMACGIPFSGSSRSRKNVKLPLKAIVYLSQAKENSITRLRGARAFSRIWEGCGVPMWDRKAVEQVAATLSAVLTQVPVYHLACTPDQRAVELLKHTMEVEK